MHACLSGTIAQGWSLSKAAVSLSSWAALFGYVLSSCLGWFTTKVLMSTHPAMLLYSRALLFWMQLCNFAGMARCLPWSSEPFWAVRPAPTGIDIADEQQHIQHSTCWHDRMEWPASHVGSLLFGQATDWKRSCTHSVSGNKHCNDVDYTCLHQAAQFFEQQFDLSFAYRM